MTDKNKEALEALNNWTQDADRFIMPFGELTKAEYNLCNHAETIRNALQASDQNELIRKNEVMLSALNFIVSLKPYQPQHISSFQKYDVSCSAAERAIRVINGESEE